MANIAPSIWDVGSFMGPVVERQASSITPESFFGKEQYLPFVVRGFHQTLEEMALLDRFEGDPFTWLSQKIGNNARITTLEGELQETRLAPVIHRLPFKYFFEKFRQLDIYAVTQAPVGIRDYLKLLPFFSCGGNSNQLQPPMMWISGGLRPSKSVVHADSHHNQHCVLKGSKKFMLIPPSVPVDTPDYGWVYVENPDGTMREGFEDAYGDYAAEIDYNNMDLDRFPKWRDVPWFLAELQAGDCLYMPVDWYHYVESDVGPTLTWHQWFHSPDKWVDEVDCPVQEVAISKCVFKKDDQRSVPRHVWEAYPNNTSLCTTERQYSQ